LSLLKARNAGWPETEAAVPDAFARIKSAVEIEESDERSHSKLSLKGALQKRSNLRHFRQTAGNNRVGLASSRKYIESRTKAARK
jgi:hypothetical protein